VLAIERKREILSRLSADGKVIVADLAKEFGVTEETVRRDLEKLDSEGLAYKIYGGAVSRKSGVLDLPYSVRVAENVEEKEIISNLVADIIKDGDRILLDSSSTNIYIVKKLKSKKNLTIITNSVKILLELSDKPDFTVLCTGGSLKEGSLSLTGSSAEKMISSYHVDFAICSCKGIDLSLGVTDSSEKDGQIKQAMFASADKKILALDTGKFDRKSFVKLWDVKDLDMIITNACPSEQWQSYLHDHGVQLIYMN
jgi:DeoR/GlpR family transcriptional regulator of sugar metabolism